MDVTRWRARAGMASLQRHDRSLFLYLLGWRYDMLEWL